MERSRHIEQYLSNFEAFERNLNGEASAEIHAVRKAAIKRFSELGFPTTRQEDWKYTDITPLVNVQFAMLPAGGVPRVRVRDIETLSSGTGLQNYLVCVNGVFEEKISRTSALPKGVRVGSLASALRDRDPLVRDHLARYAGFEDNSFTALNTAFLRDGVFVHIPDAVVVDSPLHLVFVSTQSESEFVTHPRNLIIAGKNSQAVVVERYVHLAGNRYFTNVVTELTLGENASLEHDMIQLESERAFHIGTLHAHLGRSSNFVSNNVSLGGALVRNTITVVLDGEGGEATLNGLYTGRGDQVVDNHTTIDHARPHCGSHELYKGILDGRSKGVFNGKIIVRKDAQKTDAKQTNKNLLLSDGATIDTKPQLEIYANDVKCTHGATTGQLDDESLFYMRSRGIPYGKAREMLIDAFAIDVLDRVRTESVRQELQRFLQERLVKIRRGGT